MVFDTRQLGVILLTAAALGCHGAAQPPLSPPSAPVVQPGAPGEPGRTVEAGAAPRLRHTSADTRFMQGMIGHHAQAIEMTDLLKTRTTRDDMKLLALRIDVSQTDEIRMMKRWLLDHGETVPDDHAHHMSGATLMPTLLELIGAKGTAPKNIDGISLADTLLGKSQEPREFLYREFPSYGGQQIIRVGDWKAVRQNMTKGNLTIELYNLADDIGEHKDLARQHPEIVEKLAKLMEREHTPSAIFPLIPIDAPAKKPARGANAK
jgi:uncharacterized protein (DUF305 family)